jgi:glycosyltransferase involved in cell wall biosynthesis
MTRGSHEWFLYSDRRLAESYWYEQDNVVVRHGDSAPRSLASLIHANWRFARWAARDKVSLYWSPRHHLPLSMPASLPAVVTVHDLVWRRFPATLPWRNRQLERLLMGTSLRNARAVIAVSGFTRSELLHFYPRLAPRITVIHEGGSRLELQTEPTASQPYFLFVGTAEPRKNLPVLLRGFAGFLDSGEFPHRLVLAGAPGWGGVAVDRMCEELNIQTRVVSEGYVSEERLAELYAGAEALLLPSLYEGFGLPVVEAMSFGTPVIVSDRGALPEVAGDGGLLIEPDEPVTISAAMHTLVTNRGLRESLGEAAERQSERFSWAGAAEATLALLESVAGQP